MVFIANSHIAQWFDEIADFLELDQANPYRVRAYRRVAGIVRQYPRNLAKMVMHSEDLTDIPSIGPDTAAKIREIVLTGSSHFLDRIVRQVPAGLQRLRRIEGLGPKRIRSLYDNLGVKTLGELRAAARAHQIRDLPGFGPVLEERILRRSRKLTPRLYKRVR